MSEQGPAIDYLAKDYESLRQLMLDRLAATLPAWSERHPPDLGIAIVEALAYVGDYLSYYQDAVATEAYLGTARRRISVRRHARLLDYVLHEGCNARAWVQICVNCNLILDPSKLEFLAIGKTIGSSPVATAHQLGAARDGTPDQAHVKFLPLYHCPIELRESWNCIALQGPLDAGATRARLSSNSHPHFKQGSVLILQAQPPIRDKLKKPPPKYHAVALLGVEEDQDGNRSIVWHEDDALPGYMANIRDVHALGNIVLVDQGDWVTETKPRVSNGRLGPLAKTRVTHREPAQFPFPHSAAKAISQDPRVALPQIILTETKARPHRVWGEVKLDLLESLRSDRHFCEEVEDNGEVWLRFGDDDGVGVRPKDDKEDDTIPPQFSVTYRIGNGESGNVPAEAIAQLIVKEPVTKLRSAGPANPTFAAAAQAREPFRRVWNPMAAVGGTEPESIARARLLAPADMRVRQHRAISAQDYTNFAREVAGVHDAAVTILQQGARRVVRVAVHPLWLDLNDASGNFAKTRWRALARRVHGRLDQVRRINHDVSIVAPTYVDVVIGLKIGIFRSYVRASVRAAVEGALGFTDPSDGKKGLFHPDNVTFGQSIHWSKIASTVHHIPGVAYVEQLEFRRADGADRDGQATRPVIEIGPLEIAYLSRAWIEVEPVP